jgi:intraflagellar transport protein 80
LLLHFNTETFKSFNEPITIHSSITCLAWQPLQSRQRHATKNSLLAIGCADGTLVIFTPSSDSHNFSKPEPKKIKAHEGAITKVQWSSDGSSLLSSGEDGEIKVWSQAGHLRSILSRLSSTVHCIAWNYECTAVVSTHNCILSIHNVQNKDVIEWKVGGGDELKPVAILTVDWSNKSNLIACGGEDCKYYIFDERGLLLFTSLAFNNPITNISWLPNGGALFLGSYDELRICSQHGKALRIIDTKSYSSIVDIQCSEDSAQVVTLHDNGLMIAADLIGKVFEWNGVMIEQLDGNQLRLDIMNKQSCEILQISK